MVLGLIGTEAFLKFALSRLLTIETDLTGTDDSDALSFDIADLVALCGRDLCVEIE